VVVTYALTVALQLPVRGVPPAWHGASATGLIVFLIVLGVLGTLVALIGHRRGPRVRDGDREWHARAVMSELCPDGWTAEITIYGWGAPPPPDAPPSPTPLVSITWSEYKANEHGETRIVVARRVWARSVADALEEMISDRRLDLELEEIEHRAQRNL
jgi:hypothetical protein